MFLSALLLVALGPVLAEASTSTDPAFVGSPSATTRAFAARLGRLQERISSRGGGDVFAGAAAAGGGGSTLKRMMATSPEKAAESGARRRRGKQQPLTDEDVIFERDVNTPLDRLSMSADDGNFGYPSPYYPRAPSSRGSAFAKATSVRGGGWLSSSSSDSSSSGDKPIDTRPVVAAAVKGLGVGNNKKQTRLAIDRVEDFIGHMWTALMIVAVPAFHLGRLSFGLSLLFYGMAFRTFAFHVIVFRIAGYKQVKRALSQLGSKYREARQSVREAAEAAETVGERVVKGDELKLARERMVQEKKRLLADGVLTAEETSYFMSKYNTELKKIKEEQDQFSSARSSVLSVRRSVDPRQAQSSLQGLLNALITSFTASTIRTAGQITLGLHVGHLLKTHILDLFGPVIDPIGYRLDLNTYYDKEDIPYMGKANAMDGPQNLALNILCYSAVFVTFRVHPSEALKISMVYYGARVVTGYIIKLLQPIQKRLGLMSIVHTPYSGLIHAGLTYLGYRFHRNVLHTYAPGMSLLATGPGLVGLVEPCVKFFVMVSTVMNKLDFFSCRFVEDPLGMAKNLARK